MCALDAERIWTQRRPHAGEASQASRAGEPSHAGEPSQASQAGELSEGGLLVGVHVLERTLASVSLCWRSVFRYSASAALLRSSVAGAAVSAMEPRDQLPHKSAVSSIKRQEVGGLTLWTCM